MKLTLIATFFAATFVAAAADAPPEHVAWMKEIAQVNGKINKGDDMKTNAARMATLMKTVAGYWTPKDAAAGKLATDAATGAANLAAGTGDEMANKAMIGASCRGCHPAHREGTAAPYSIK